MENNEIDSKINEQIAAFEAAELAKAQEKIERKKAAIRARLEKEMEEKREREQAVAALQEKLAKLPEELGYTSMVDLVRDLGKLLSPQQRGKLFAVEKKPEGKKCARRGPGNGLSDEERAEIAKLRAEGVSTKELAAKFNISVNTVYGIKKAKIETPEA